MGRVKVAKEDSPPKKSGGLYFGSPKTDVQFISSGCKTFDLALGGGWARRRISNIVGDKAAGKTLCAIEACANFAMQEPKGKIRYREAESAFDENYAAALGLPVERIDFGDPVNTIEDVFQDLEKVIEGAKGDPELYIIDSLDSLSDEEEMERDISEGTYGMRKAKKLSELFRRQVRGLAEKDIHLMVISQIRDNVNAGMFAKKHTRTGGKALDFYASQIAWLTQIEKVKKTINKQTRVIGTWVKMVVEKNKVGLPYREAEFQILFGYGIEDRAACLEYLKQAGIEVAKDNTLAELHKAVEAHWWEVENSFLTKEPKYGKN
jgi:recombination protein RecA